MDVLGMNISEVMGKAEEYAGRGLEVRFLLVSGKPAAVFGFERPMRGGGYEAVLELREAGIGVTLLGGVNERVGRAVAEACRLGADEVLKAATVEEKAAAIRKIKEKIGIGVVGVVGEGTGDADILRAGDIGIALGKGDDLKADAAGIVLISGDPRGVVRAIVLARRAMIIIRENMVWAAAYNATIVPLAFLGYIHPVLGALVMAASSVLVLVNSLRIVRLRVH
jgi:P-type E1-E2 ATPase